MDKKSVGIFIIGLGALAFMKYLGFPLGNLFNYIVGAGLLLGFLQGVKDNKARTWMMIVGIFFLTKGVDHSVSTNFLFRYISDYVDTFIWGLGFYSVYALGKQTQSIHHKNFGWALGIAKFLFVIGIIGLVFSLFGFAFTFVFKYLWAIILIAIGVSMLKNSR